MIQIIKLLIPALIPSWRFFDEIAPSPRVEYCLLETPTVRANSWQEFRPRPLKTSIKDSIKSLFHNPLWNEYLFMSSCAERLIQNPTPHSEREIINRILYDIYKNTQNKHKKIHLQFRLVFIARTDKGIENHVAYISPVHSRSHSTFDKKGDPHAI